MVALKLRMPFEILFVNDGSTDKTREVLATLSEQFPEVRSINFSRNHGQSAALAAGFQRAQGNVIITLDADLQNDPHDIPALLSFFGSHDMINGWRKQRNDNLSKRLASRLGNFIRNLLTKETIKDTGCSLKVMRADMAKRIKMFRGLHRFLPTLMRLEGARIIEVPVNHRKRVHGVSKYNNLRRGIEGFHDLLAVRWMIRRHLTLQEGICLSPKQ
jgi:dolichol-phosphate mannosyltransferase